MSAITNSIGRSQSIEQLRSDQATRPEVEQVASGEQFGQLGSEALRVRTDLPPHPGLTLQAPDTAPQAPEPSSVSSSVGLDAITLDAILGEPTEVEVHAGELDHGDDTIPLPAFTRENQLTKEDCQYFLKSQIAAGERLAPGLDFAALKQKANAFDIPRDSKGEQDSAALKKAIKSFTKEVQHILAQADPILASKLEPARHAFLAKEAIWTTGYEKTDTFGKNCFVPLAGLSHVRDASGLEAKTCHAHVSEQPTNVWKTSYGQVGIETDSSFYRHGTFAPSPSKLGEKWTKDEKQLVASQRAITLVTSLVADFIHNNPGHAIDRFTFSNVNLMSRFHGEPSLSALHREALQQLDGRPIQVTVDGRTHDVVIDVRAWRQDIKDAGYFGTNKEMRSQNRKALQSLERSMQELQTSGRASPNELADMKAMKETIEKQLDLQEVKGISRLFAKALRGLSTTLGFPRHSPRMDPSEVTALIVGLESKIAKHQPGAVSQGCKSGKDRGSIADVACKALFHEISANGGRLPVHVLKPGWMLSRAKENAGFREDLKQLFLGNYELQKANTGFKGYITSDIKVLLGSHLGARNYIEKLADFVFDDSNSIKAGSRMIKS